MNKHFNFKVPSGIGDLSWLYSKLVNLPEGWTFDLEICGDDPKRTRPFAAILPKVKSSCYGDFPYWSTFVTEKKGLPPDTEILNLEPGDYYLSANLWLEMGGRLQNLFPDLDTSYHYKMDISETAREKAKAWLDLDKFPRPFIGVYTSKYNGGGEWKLWKHQLWTQFLKRVHKSTGGTFVFLGASFDLELGQQVAYNCRDFAPRICLIGETHISECVAVMERLDYLFAYASGIGILGDVVDVPTYHFLPTPRLDGMINTYADPGRVKADYHINKSFCSPEEAYADFARRGLEYIIV